MINGTIYNTPQSSNTFIGLDNNENGKFETSSTGKKNINKVKQEVDWSLQILRPRVNNKAMLSLFINKKDDMINE